MPSDPYTDDEYDDTYETVHGDEPARDKYADETADDLFFPSGVGGSLHPSNWGLWPSKDATDAEYDQYEDRTGASGSTEGTEGGSRWEGPIGLVLVVGVGLFLFPEPATSAVGIGLIAIGLLAWVADRIT